MTAPDFRWPRFLIAFIAAPLLFTLFTFWALIPLYALMLGGPLYLIAGLPLAAWHLSRHPFNGLHMQLLAQVCQLLQIPIFIVLSLYNDDPELLQALPFFLTCGALFALIWTSAFIGLYRLLARAERDALKKEPQDVHP